MGYFMQVENNAKRARIRGYDLNSGIPTGAGTIYSWDFAYMNSKKLSELKKPVSESNSNATMFRYIGLSSQENTMKRITAHRRDSGTEGDRRLYRFLKEAIDQNIEGDYSGLFPKQGKPFDEVVQVVHYVSNLDLSNVESYMIENGNSGFKGGALNNDSEATFEKILNNDNSSKKIGLNTTGGKESSPITVPRKNIDIIVGAYIYLTDFDSTISAARANNKPFKLPSNTEILEKAGRDYVLATIYLIEDIQKNNQGDNALSYIKTKDVLFLKELKAFYGKIDKTYLGKEGFDMNGKNVIPESKFQGSVSLQTIFTYQISDNKVSQTTKPILLSEFLLSNIKDSDVEKYLTKIQTGLSEQTSKGAIIANLKLKANENHVNGLEKIIKNKMDQVMIRIKTRLSKGEGNLDLIYEEALNNIAGNISSKHLGNVNKKDFAASLKSSNQIAFQKARMGQQFVSYEDTVLIINILTEYIIGYVLITDKLPSQPEITKLLSQFSNTQTESSFLIQSQLTKKSSKSTKK
jgi:hypothetical protein